MKFKKLLAALICIMLVISSLSFAVLAEETEEDAPSEEFVFAEALAKTLEIYARYPDVTLENLYGGAIEKLLEDDPELLDKILSAMLSSIDEHSIYYTKDEASKLFDSLTDEVVGIGVNVLSLDNNTVVSQVMPDTPAEKAGMKTGDIIVEADGVSLVGMDLDTAVSHIRGEIGTEVTLKVYRASVKGYVDITMTREKVISNQAIYEVVEKGGKKIAKILLYSFTENSYKHFKDALDKADKEGIKNIIIDLRNNGGGYFDQAIMIADEFLPEGAIITSEDHKINEFDVVYTAEGPDTDYDVVILINKNSASSSEVLTAALKENNKARVIGTNSYGKGTVQSILPLKNDSVIKFTTAYYLTPNGNNINKVGITPDAVVENSSKPVDMSKFGTFDYSKVFAVGESDPQIKAAKEMLAYIGLYIGDIDEYYDENLRVAVYTYQDIKEGLFPYGELDKTTQLSLYQTVSELKEETDDQLEAALSAF